MRALPRSIRYDENGAPERIRTSDTQLRRLVLYPAELRAHPIVIEKLLRQFLAELPLAAEHPRDLRDAFAPIEDPRRGYRPFALHLLLDPYVMSGPSGDLRQVGNANDLISPCELREPLRHDAAEIGPEPRIDFIEYERRDPLLLDLELLEYERYSREFPTRRDIRERMDLLPDVRTDRELDAIPPSRR
jgi:hypothetical protein